MAHKIDKATFIDKVFDFENEQDWNYKGSVPAIVDFYADWCGPCKMVAPILEDLSKQYAGKLEVYKVNTDEEPELASAFGIQSIPSLLFIPLGDKPQMSMGALPKAQLEKAIREVLKVQA